MDKEKMIMTNNFEDCHNESHKMDTLKSTEENIFEMKIDDKTEIEMNAVNEENGEMYFDMVYESINDLPDFVFEDIAMDLMTRNEVCEKSTCYV